MESMDNWVCMGYGVTFFNTWGWNAPIWQESMLKSVVHKERVYFRYDYL